MLRSILTSALRATSAGITGQLTRGTCNKPITNACRMFSSMTLCDGIKFLNFHNTGNQTKLLSNDLLKSLQTSNNQTRTVTKFSLNKGKRKSVKAVIKRFKRLDWGCWIRTHSGRHKKLFKKSPALRRRLKQHVLVNASQSFLLDKMVTKFWRKPKYYIDDPYEPYMKREEYWATKTKPTGF